MTVSNNTRLCYHKSRGETVTEPDLFQEEECVFSTRSEMVIAEKSVGQGIVHVSNQRVIFVPESSSGDVVSFDYKSMVMHAITSAEDEEMKSLFVQLVSDEDDDEEYNDGNDIVKFLGLGEDMVGQLFSCMNEMSALNPDEMDDQVEDE